ncbi:sugar transferase [Anaerocolumna sp. AGMB13025]|uniref:sugar transferase n=1 Tax=Anaerocolumna sp. AGMB13025 TaxID=3039116 RepID=UPI00241FB488|nr:sugar transferase [Anaerocolumna sp. AGMB13025]WFR56325.1 sugar transferase [Anaerocolumna sp. AGMB13025]
MYIKYYKRIIDFVLSLIAIVLLLWLFFLLMLFIKLTSKGPVFFRQKRIGKNKSEFYILKFRTMRIDTPSDMPTHLLENPEKYITVIGKILRKTSLDELPQLFNIIKGDMSIVGPRPALWNQYDLIEERDKYGANDVKPGLTGWAQINGRDELPIPLKAKLDGEYIKKISFMFDIKCIIKTVGCVIRRDGQKEGTTEVSNNS